jgi:uncharacterized protein YktA (UPF0223 family)
LSDTKIERGYTTGTLEAGIEACKKNIKTFEDAIEKEYATIKQFREMKEIIERKKQEAHLKQTFSKENILH